MTGVIFDVDGVLLDSMSIWMQAGERYLKRKGKQPEENLGEKLFSMSMEEGASYLKETGQLSESIETICDEINQLLMDSYEYSIPLKTGVLETLSYLKQKKVPMVIATSSDAHVIQTAFSRLGIVSCFLKIFTCTDIGAGKDRPDIFLAAAEYIESISHNHSGKKDDIWVVEDSLCAAKTAKNAGFSVIGIYDEASSQTWNSLCNVVDIYSREMKPELFQ